MANEISGTVFQVLKTQSGQGKNGTWTKQDYIIETGGQYPKKICVSVWGDKLPKLQKGDVADFSFDVESREYNDKWYTEVRVYKIDFQKKPSGKSDRDMTGGNQYTEDDADSGLPF